MTVLCLAKFVAVNESTHPWKPVPHPVGHWVGQNQCPARQKRAKSSITQPWIIRFRSQSLNTWHPKCC